MNARLNLRGEMTNADSLLNTQPGMQAPLLSLSVLVKLDFTLPPHPHTLLLGVGPRCLAERHSKH